MITLNVDVIIERIEFSKNMDDISSFSTILCEGSTNSLDFKIYSRLFDNKLIIPCGANSILKIKELKLYNHENICAITDRDTATNEEIINLKKYRIFTIKTRAVENLLVTDEVLYRICEKNKTLNYEEKVDNIKTILLKKYGKKLNKIYDIEIDKENILEFYNPKKVIDTVTSMLSISKADYINDFFELMDKDKELINTIKELV